MGRDCLKGQRLSWSILSTNALDILMPYLLVLCDPPDVISPTTTRTSKLCCLGSLFSQWKVCSHLHNNMKDLNSSQHSVKSTIYRDSWTALNKNTREHVLHETKLIDSIVRILSISQMRSKSMKKVLAGIKFLF